jgi:hypothetical protein
MAGVSDGEKKIVRTSNGTFAAGTNTGGRHKGLASRVRELVGNNLDAMIAAQVAIATGKKPPGIEVELPPIKAADMTKAFEALRDSGWGRPLQQVEHSGALDGRIPTDYSQLSDEELDAKIAEDEAREREAATGDDGSSG